MAVNFPVYQPPDVSGAFAQGQQDATRAAEAPLTLANMLDEQKMNKLTLANAEKQSRDQEQIKSILKGVDYSSPEGLSKATAALSQGGYGQEAMNLMRFGQQYASGEHQQRLDKLEETSKQQTRIATELDIAMAQLDAMKAANPSADPKALDVQAAAIVDKVLPQLKQDHPDLAPQIDQWSKNPGLRTYAGLKKFEEVSNQSTALLNKQIEAMRLSLEQQRLATTTRQGDERLQQGWARINLSRSKGAADSSGSLSADDARFAAQQYLAGDKTVFQGLGRGKQGAENITKIRAAIRDEAQQRGMSAGDVAAKQAEFQALVAAERKIGTTEGGVEWASAELNKFLPLARSASQSVGRADFTPFNSLVQVGEHRINDPALRKLYVNTQGVLNAYDVLAARGGTDAAKREHNRQMLTTADTPDVYNTALDAIQQELDSARGAAGEARRGVAADFAGKPPASSGVTGARAAATAPASGPAPAPAPAAGAAPGPPAAAGSGQTRGIPTEKLPQTNNQGWTLHTDALGRRAYVGPPGPDGKPQVQVVP